MSSFCLRARVTHPPIHPITLTPKPERTVLLSSTPYPTQIPPQTPTNEQCFLKPTYLRAADGRRLLTYLFGLHPGLVADIHATVKAQLPHVRMCLVACRLFVYFMCGHCSVSLCLCLCP